MAIMKSYGELFYPIFGSYLSADFHMIMAVKYSQDFRDPSDH